MECELEAMEVVDLGFVHMRKEDRERETGR
jgi:hypothetical protein